MFPERAPRSAPVSDQTNHWYALALRPRCAGIHGVRVQSLAEVKYQPCLTEHRPLTGFVRLRSPRILPLPIRLARLSGCRWLINAQRQDPRVYYFQRSLPPIVSQSSLGPVLRDLLTIRRPAQPPSATTDSFETIKNMCFVADRMAAGFPPQSEPEMSTYSIFRHFQLTQIF
jgi:hypothetical protein